MRKFLTSKFPFSKKEYICHCLLTDNNLKSRFFPDSPYVIPLCTVHFPVTQDK